MKKSIFKIITIIGIAATAFLGINFSQEKVNVSGERADITLISLGNQAKTYCNERGPGNFANGLCTGAFDDPTTRCLPPADPTAFTTCVQ